MVFFLCVVEGRVILDGKSHGTELETIEAEPEYEGEQVYRSAWQVARDFVRESRYQHFPGYGYYLKGSIPKMWAGLDS